ncbi:MAG TPA: DUF3300 domain-containing protein [Pyrinomonadaceae bacterium]
MNKLSLKIQTVGLAISLLTFYLPLARASRAMPANFSDAELDELFSPIALYPDPLLAQVVPAATFIDQLEDAQRVMNGRSDDNLISQQSWDVSVKSVAHYPQILKMMVDKRDWTTAVGQAYVNQSTDVGKAIQRLRAEAKSAGSLVTTSQQEVIVDGNTIKIVPAQPQVIYVPQYNPQTVYVEQDSGPSTGAVIAAAAISFGAGLAIGAWLNNDWDWYGRGVYYHGWVGGGWVGVNRSFVNVNVNRNIYVNNRYNNINLNRNVVNRNINNYRTSLNRNATVRQNNFTRNNINRNNINTNNINRNNINTNNINRNNVNRNNVNRNNDALKNRTDNSKKLDSYRGRETQNNSNRPNSNSVFGSGGNRDQVKQQRDRGSNSIQKMKTDRGSGRFGNRGGARKVGGGGLRRRG